jgi:hypothetical protein
MESGMTNTPRPARILVTRAILSDADAAPMLLSRDLAIGAAGRALEGTDPVPAWLSPPMSLAAVGAIVAALALDG